jgi:hypothetical protein
VPFYGFSWPDRTATLQKVGGNECGLAKPSKVLWLADDRVARRQQCRRQVEQVPQADGETRWRNPLRRSHI